MTPLTLAHAALISEMHKVCFKVPWSEKDMAETLAMPGAFGYLAAGEGPEGFVLARVAAGEAEILSLLVLPPYRRKGVGKALLEAAIAMALSLNAEMMFLEVDAENIRAQLLYESFEFYTVGLRPRYYGETDALVLRKDLSPPQVVR